MANLFARSHRARAGSRAFVTAGYPAAGAPGTVSRSQDAVPAWIVAAWRLLAFTWTKTADEILNSLAGYLAELSASQPVNKQE